jgi:hypothetical protein
MIATDLSTFHCWLLSEAGSDAHAIVIHGCSPPLPQLAADVARYLNEFDEDSRGNWLAFTPGLIELIAESSTQRCLLGLDKGCECASRQAGCDHTREILQKLAEHGHAILQGESAAQACRSGANVFRVWLGSPRDSGEMTHLILHPEHFSDRSLPAIIADTFLEWASSRLTKRT